MSQVRAVIGFGVFTALLVGAAYVAGGSSEGGVAAIPTMSIPEPAANAGPPTGGQGVTAPSSSFANAPHLFQEPSLSQKEIAFNFAGEIWTVAREGGRARRIVSGQLRNRRAMFSPDGSRIAFTGTFDSNADVYVVASGGGELTRLTYHPGVDYVVGWTPDGSRVIFGSSRGTPRDLDELFTVPLGGGLPDKLPIPNGIDGSLSPDGKRLAYVPFPQWQPDWKKYRGGQTSQIWLADLADSRITKIPRDNSNDVSPMWVGDNVFFVSDRNGPATLFSYDTKTAAVKELVHNADGFGIRSATAGPGGIVWEELGAIRLYDFAQGKAHVVPITIADELPLVRARMEKIDSSDVLHAAISPTGKRVLVEAHGEIMSIPVEKGDARNLTRSPAVADRDPSWSPDGKWITWLSDESGEYALYFRSPDGLGPLRKVDLGAPPSYFYAPRWSPDSKKVVLTDKRLQMWLVDAEKGAPVLVDTDRYETAAFDPAWSPDSKWITYAKQLPNHLRAVFVYSIDDKKTRQVTDGRSDTSSPRFDRSGKYLYFIASTDVGLAQGGGEMTAMGRPTTASIYAAILEKDRPSPLAPESDEEGDAGAPQKRGRKRDAKEPLTIDFDGIDQRIIALPFERTRWITLETGAEGVLFATKSPVVLTDEDYIERNEDNRVPYEVSRFDLASRKVEHFLDKIDGYDPTDGTITFSVSADGTKILFARDKKWFVIGTEKGKSPEPLHIDGTEMWIDPRAEWKQIFHEVWRIERDFLYDPKAHGLDLAAAEKLYAPFVDGIASRRDLNVLFGDMLGNIVLGHVWAYGGSMPHQDHVSVGLLGADYKIEDGRYRIARILTGENWNPRLRAPLTQPGVDVKEGDFILAINGQELTARDDIDRLLLGRAGKQTVIKFGSSAKGGGARDVTVVPTGGEEGLRLRTWMEDNKKKVDALSGGRVGYVFIPNTAGEGMTNFNRYYFSQVEKEAVVLDERFNHGGQIADYIVNVLSWQPHMGATTREGEDVTMPPQAIFGPKVMIANQMSGSGGDALPWLFKRANLGPLVGVRTWGGLVGIGGYPKLIDGGGVTAPRWGLYGTKGEWEVENKGIAPDVEVEQDPALVRQGHDPQLEKAVELALAALAKNPPQKLTHPPFPDYGPRLPKRAP